MPRRDTREFACPNDDCGFRALIDYVPATRWDPGYLDGDPPEDCPDCGADMTGVADEPADPDEGLYDRPEYEYDR